MVNCFDLIFISMSLHMLVQIFVKILFLGSRTSLVLVDTSSVSSNTANPENESEEQSSPPRRRKRQCAPLNLTEPSLKRQVWQRC